jgi:hypothetical protein
VHLCTTAAAAALRVCTMQGMATAAPLPVGAAGLAYSNPCKTSKVLKLSHQESEFGVWLYAREMAIPAAARGYNARTGSCSADELSGGELLFNDDGLKSMSGLGKARRSRLMVVQDAAGASYLVVVNGAAGAAAGGRIGMALEGRDLVGQCTVTQGCTVAVSSPSSSPPSFSSPRFHPPPLHPSPTADPG